MKTVQDIIDAGKTGKNKAGEKLSSLAGETGKKMWAGVKGSVGMLAGGAAAGGAAMGAYGAGTDRRGGTSTAGLVGYGMGAGALATGVYSGRNLIKGAIGKASSSVKGMIGGKGGASGGGATASEVGASAGDGIRSRADYTKYADEAFSKMGSQKSTGKSGLDNLLSGTGGATSGGGFAGIGGDMLGLPSPSSMGHAPIAGSGPTATVIPGSAIPNYSGRGA